MFIQTLRNRLIVIGLLVAASVFSLFPRSQTIRERGPDGVMRDTVMVRVPLKRGLDLQGGIHLELELDQSQQVSADPKRDIDLALTVLRKRIDEFGVTEPVIQKQGQDRIVVELAGVADPARAMAIVQRSAFLEFRITDRTGALDKALPSMDRVLRSAGLTVDTTAKPSAPSAVTQLLQGDSAKKGDTTQAAGEISQLIQPATSVRLAGAGRIPRPGRRLPAGGQLAPPARGGAADPAQHRAPLGCRPAQRAGPVLPAALRPGGPAAHHRLQLVDAKAADRPADQRADRRLQADRAGRPQVRPGHRRAHRRLHGHRAGRPGPGPAARHPGPDRPPGADHAGQQDDAGRAGPGADAEGRRASGAAQDRGEPRSRSRASARTRSTRASWPDWSAPCW